MRRPVGNICLPNAAADKHGRSTFPIQKKQFSLRVKSITVILHNPFFLFDRFCIEVLVFKNTGELLPGLSYDRAHFF